MASIAQAMQENVAGAEAMPEEELTEEELALQQEEQKRQRELEMQKIDQLGQSLARTRSEAIQARQQSGIEEEWLEDEEFYQGIDDANRAESKSTWRRKPMGQAEQPSGTPTTRSTVFPNITRPYTDAAAARIADMLLPTDDRSWALKPTPLPNDAEGVSKKKYPPELLRKVAAQYPGQPELAQKELAIATKAALEVIAEAKAKADKAQTRIEDWHVECQWHANVRLVIEDAARIGTGILKGPVPMRKDRIAYQGGKIKKASEIKPGSKWIDPWNFYPDNACGENVHNGSYTWEKDGLTSKQLRELKDQDGYLEEQIDLCLTEGPQRATAEYKETPEQLSEQDKKRQFEIWYFHGTAEKEDLEAAGVDVEGVTDPHVPVMIVMVNNRVIKAALNPLDTGEFPYDVMVWQRRSGHWTGIGVARQIRTPQRIVTAATRNLMDNAGLAAGPMLVYFQGKVLPADGKAGIAPRKVWMIAEDADGIEDANKAIGQIAVEMLVEELMRIIELGLKLAEDVTGLPMLLQGQQGKAPDTVGGMQMLNNNASAVLRRLARLFDDRITEPHVRRYYTWLLEDPKVPEEEKGDYCIDARGSSALVERDIQNQEIAQMGAIVTNPVFGLDPKKWASEYLKSRHFDPKRFEFDDDKWQQIVENMSKGPADPRLAVAELRAQTDEKLLQLEQAFEAHENERDRQFEFILKEFEQDGQKAMTLDQLKAKLADTVMKLRTQRDLSARDNAVTVATKKPPTEPAGRAKRGEAYQH